MEDSAIFKLLSDPTRLNIIKLLLGAKRDLCVYEVAKAVDISRSATSHQLAKLEARGIVCSYKEGQHVCYQLEKNETVKAIKRIIKATRNR